MATKPAHSPEELISLLIAGGRNAGRTNVQAAVHLLTFTELPHHTGFAKAALDIQRVKDWGSDTVYDAAFVRDWTALPKLRTAVYMGGGDHRLLALAISLATGTPVDLSENTSSFGHAYARRVIEAFTIATGTAKFYTVTSTTALDDMLAANAALLA